MRKPRSITPRPLGLFASVLATAALVLPGALAGAPAAAAGTASSAPTAHASSAYLTGLGDQSVKMFSSSLWRQLHTRTVRYIAPYDAVAHSYSLSLARRFIQAAEAQHQQVLVAFYHSEYTPTRLPSAKLYQHDVQKFIRLFPKVKQYQSWDEANRGNIPHALASPSAKTAALYYQALTHVCTGCTMIGLDVLDAAVITPTLRYISEFKREVRHLKAAMPRVWGLHNYSDVNRQQSWRTRALVSALGGEVWLTETGGLVKFGGAYPNRNGSGLKRSARVLKYVFAVAGSQPRIKRIYIYNWFGGNSRTRFDAGVMNAKGQPRAGYQVLCRQLHAAKCNVKLAKN
ncbi:MAG TPA: hypothetical protein VGN13_03375 [Solirubrobacteraceae bacterium]|jgi:hypothetical protein